MLVGASEVNSTASGALREAAFNNARQQISDTPTHTIITVAITPQFSTPYALQPSVFLPPPEPFLASCIETNQDKTVHNMDAPRLQNSHATSGLAPSPKCPVPHVGDITPLTLLVPPLR